MAEYRKEMVAVDKDALDFLKVIYFGAITDPFETVSFRAYRDFNRTLRFGDTGPKQGKNCGSNPRLFSGRGSRILPKKHT